MNKFENLTKYLSLIKEDNIGTWVIDRENDGTPEHPIQMPFVYYSRMVDHFIDDVCDFVAENKEFELTHYYDVLEKNGLEWKINSMRNANVSSLSAQCVLALIVGSIRADRFCDGALLSFFKNGCVEKWLRRLEEIDKGTVL